MSIKEINLLQIEDNPGDARLIYEMLKSIEEVKYTFEHITTLDEGKKRILKGDIDIILLDLGLVGSSGLETLQKLLSSEDTDIPPVIVMTGLTDEESALEAVKQGAQDYLLKNNITSDLLNRSIHYALERNNAKKKLKKAYAELDEKVKERTAELSKTVKSLEKEISERKKAEDTLKKINIELAAAKEKAEENNRLKSAFLSNLSHEIRTPMNGILGFINILDDMDLTKEMRDKYIETINTSGHRLLKTVNDIIELSKIESEEFIINFENINPSEILHNIYNIFKEQATEKNLSFNYIEMPEIKPVILWTDKNKLESILSRLISNAIKFTDSGSIELSSYIKDNNIIFSIKDTGRGIPADKFNIIFDNFVQGDIEYDRGYEGAGLGLSISKAYTHKLKGKIWLESEKDKGSTFYLSLPL